MDSNDNHFILTQLSTIRLIHLSIEIVFFFKMTKSLSTF